MKTMHMFATVLCAVACTFSAAIAEDDSGLVSATPVAPVITDPVNPQPGMIYSAYALSWMNHPGSYFTKEEAEKLLGSLRECHSTLPKMPALQTGVDSNNTFTVECAKGVKPYGIRWDGFLKCKLSGTYTFLVQKKSVGDGRDIFVWCSYVIKVNGKVIVSQGEDSFDVDLKTGFNKVEIFCLFPPRWEEVAQAPMIISAKRKGSIIEPVKLSPGMLFYDARPELTETGL